LIKLLVSVFVIDVSVYVVTSFHCYRVLFIHQKAVKSRGEQEAMNHWGWLFYAGISSKVKVDVLIIPKPQHRNLDLA
jgi:hypothetical protein